MDSQGHEPSRVGQKRAKQGFRTSDIYNAHVCDASPTTFMFRVRPQWSRPCRPLSALNRPWALGRYYATLGGAKKDIWAEKVLVDKRYPLSRALNKVIHPKLESKPKRGQKKKKAKDGFSDFASSATSIHVRSQLVSPNLCDDVISYIGHTLEKHKGCDILDINPGAGLWSQKLHEFLQPRSHVLLEPRPDKFQPFLDPLLKALGSKYSLIVKDPCDLNTYRALVEDGVFLHQTLRDPQDPMAKEYNNTLLVTGSLVWDPRLPGMGFDSMAKQLYYQFTSAARSNTFFHAFGLLRTLFWVQTDDFGPMVAESVAGMQKANRSLEMTHNINVVVKAERAQRKLGKASTGREPHYEIESTIRAMKAGRENGMELPPHRRESIHDFAEDIDSASKGTGIARSFFVQDYLYRQQLAGKSTVGLVQEGLVEHYNQEKHLRNKYPDLDFDVLSLVPREKTGPKLMLAGHPARAEVTKLTKRRAIVYQYVRIKTDIEALVDVAEEIYLLECKILKMKEGARKEKSMQKLTALEEEWEKGFSKILHNYAAAPLTEIDDRLALRTPPYPRLQWDRRPYDPLIMSPSEVWPQNRLSLISSEPIARMSSQDPDWIEWVQDFIYELYAQPHTPIKQALDSMQHGLSDIIKDCPSLTDPEKGGRLQMHHFRIRLLTTEMIEELVAAYRKWPFKAPESDHNRYFRQKGASQSLMS